MQTTKRKRGAFTLIEVMVIGCVAIILMVLCVPSIKEARASNLAQLQLMKLAVNDYNNNGSDVTPPVVDCHTCYTALYAGCGNPLVDVGLTVTATDDQDPAPQIEICVYSDEAEGSTIDATDIANGTLKLRAERDPKVPGMTQAEKKQLGRVYLIIAKATDLCDNVGYNCCTVVVPYKWNCKWFNRVCDQAADAEATCSLTGSAPSDYNQLLGF